ncbi:diaminopimelate decarboxylase [Bacteroidia bacterium]|nr:diaminopimelate decarboxylase [Bacteroidia bacterium]
MLNLESIKNIPTPCYVYDLGLLEQTLSIAKNHANKYNYHLHYAIKANANKRVLEKIAASGFGADCVSGGEIKVAIDAGFSPSKIVYAGVGKSDKEINFAIEQNILCFNVESLPELLIIEELAYKQGKTVNVALRVNPDIKADTHSNIATGSKEKKFGINIDKLDEVLDTLKTLKNVVYKGIHLHIGSQILNMNNFVDICNAVNDLQILFEKKDFVPEIINIGGGLGIDYQNPQNNPVPDFANYFATINEHLNVKSGQQIHLEPGRSIVGQSGALLTEVLYIKEGSEKKFAIVDAGMSELIRPALYDAYHKIVKIDYSQNIENLAEVGENLENTAVYDVVGPICESSDIFAKDRFMSSLQRGDKLLILSAGAYGEVMSSNYNMRKLEEPYFVS